MVSIVSYLKTFILFRSSSLCANLFVLSPNVCRLTQLPLIESNRSAQHAGGNGLFALRPWTMIRATIIAFYGPRGKYIGIYSSKGSILERPRADIYFDTLLQPLLLLNSTSTVLHAMLQTELMNGLFRERICRGCYSAPLSYSINNCIVSTAGGRGAFALHQRPRQRASDNRRVIVHLPEQARREQTALSVLIGV